MSNADDNPLIIKRGAFKTILNFDVSIRVVPKYSRAECQTQISNACQKHVFINECLISTSPEFFSKKNSAMNL